VQCLIDAYLVSAKRATALQDQRDPIAPLGSPGITGRGFRNGCSRIHHDRSRILQMKNDCQN
jgi:hypothetical protein